LFFYKLRAIRPERRRWLNLILEVFHKRSSKVSRGKSVKSA